MAPPNDKENAPWGGNVAHTQRALPAHLREGKAAAGRAATSWANALGTPVRGAPSPSPSPSHVAPAPAPAERVGALLPASVSPPRPRATLPGGALAYAEDAWLPAPGADAAAGGFPAQWGWRSPAPEDADADHHR
jgi:hypothetical protein